MKSRIFSYRKKTPVFEKTTSLAKTEAVFGVVVREDGFILVIKDNPRKGKLKRWSDSQSFYKLPGGKVFFGENRIEIISRKIRKETGVSSIHKSRKRKEILLVEKRSHFKYFYLMKYIQGSISLGKNIKFAGFFHPNEIKKMIEKGEFLEDHKLALENYFKNPVL